MKIIIDGDACPSVPLIEQLAIKYQIYVKIFCDINHCISSEYSEVKIVDSGFQNVDMYVVNETKQGDIVITQDYGVAALCLPKKASVINPNGTVYTNENIDKLLEDRHVALCMRKAGQRTKSHKKRTNKDAEKFISVLENEIRKGKAIL